MAQKCVTHLATNGAGTIHDWEYAWFGASTESVEMNVATGRSAPGTKPRRTSTGPSMAGALGWARLRPIDGPDDSARTA